MPRHHKHQHSHAHTRRSPPPHTANIPQTQSRSHKTIYYTCHTHWTEEETWYPVPRRGQTEIGTGVIITTHYYKKKIRCVLNSQINRIMGSGASYHYFSSIKTENEMEKKERIRVTTSGVVCSHHVESVQWSLFFRTFSYNIIILFNFFFRCGCRFAPVAPSETTALPLLNRSSPWLCCNRNCIFRLLFYYAYKLLIHISICVSTRRYSDTRYVCVYLNCVW